MRLTIATVLALLVCSSAYAQTPAPSVKTANGYTFKICDAETTDGICDGAGATGGDDRYVNVGQFDKFTLSYDIENANATPTCDVYASDSWTDPSADMSTRQDNNINVTSLSDANDKITFAGGDFEYVWIKCASMTGDGVTVTLRGAVGRSRTDR